MRHQHAGLPVWDFPKAHGQWWPSTEENMLAKYNADRSALQNQLHANKQTLDAAGNPTIFLTTGKDIQATHISLHMFHRVTALIILGLVLGTAILAHRKLGGGHVLSKLSLLWLGLVLVQATLGILTVLKYKPADIATLHVLVGAATLLTGAMGTVISRSRELPPALKPRRKDLTISPKWSPPVNEARSCHPRTETGLTLPVRLVVGIGLRLTTMVLITTAMGFYLASANGFDWALLLHALFGTGILAGGAAALNEYLEKDFDAKMPRTANRPIVTGAISPERALLAGGAMAAIGLVHLAYKVNLITSVVGAVTLISYVAVYTPLKRVTTLNTLIGAIPGALPPLMGWTAATGSTGAIATEGWSLVAILFFWQLPHFLAIAWIYREDYEKAGFRMISEGEQGASNTGKSAVLYCIALIPAAIHPL